ncbi:hypothetical protein DC498_21145 [Terrimonas sp.]|nr:hypothetical protein DC498_21145 [Terrimonas sp.]
MYTGERFYPQVSYSACTTIISFQCNENIFSISLAAGFSGASPTYISWSEAISGLRNAQCDGG